MHKFDKAKFDAAVTAKSDFQAHIKTNPAPNSVPVLVQRVKLLEKLLGL